MSNPIKKFEIQLDNDIDEQYQYEPGELLKGKLLLQLTHDLAVRSIQLQIRGEAMIGFEDTNRNNNNNNELLKSTEIYVDETIILFGIPEIGEDLFGTIGPTQSPGTLITKGEQVYPFEYILPSSLPSSFIGKSGSITYVIKASLKQAGSHQTSFSSNNLTTEPFLVLRRLDISPSLTPELFSPKVVFIKKRSVCDFILGRKKLECEFRIPKTGYLPGDDIPITAEISNNSGRTVMTTNVLLLLNSIFHAKSEICQNSQIVNKKTIAVDIETGQREIIKEALFPIPPFIPESNLDGCILIDIQYVLQFQLDFDDGSQMDNSLPIIIGTSATTKLHKDNERNQPWDSDNYAITSVDNFDITAGIGKSSIAFSDADLIVNKQDMEKFRHPMEEGETRANILFDGN